MAPTIIPGIFLKNGAGNARTAQTNKAIGSMPEHSGATLTEKSGEEMDEPVTVISWPRKDNSQNGPRFPAAGKRTAMREWPQNKKKNPSA